jgi:hypothetical protein
MAVDIQAWGLKAVDKIRRGFYVGSYGSKPHDP